MCVAGGCVWLERSGEVRSEKPAARCTKSHARDLQLVQNQMVKVSGI